MAHDLVLLHGFSGTRRAWDGVIAQLDPQRYTAVALDLPGHGAHDWPEDTISFEGCVASVLERAPERFSLCGYSMGARVALHVALAAPARVDRLVLIGASPGIEDARERAQRARHDEQLAHELETGPFEEFIERWRSQPLFAGEPPHVGELAREDQRRNDPLQLAAVLRRVGTGVMRPLWSRLAELRMPVELIAGERDRKFILIAQRMAAAIPRTQLMVLAGGHGLPLENPAAVAGVLEGHGQACALPAGAPARAR